MIKSIKHFFTISYIVRIGHFRCFESFWSNTAKAKTCKFGKWGTGP